MKIMTLLLLMFPLVGHSYETEHNCIVDFRNSISTKVKFAVKSKLHDIKWMVKKQFPDGNFPVLHEGFSTYTEGFEDCIQQTIRSFDYESEKVAEAKVTYIYPNGDKVKVRVNPQDFDLNME